MNGFSMRMDRTRTPRLHLSRKRKTRITDGQDTSIDFGTERRVLSSESTSDGISDQPKQLQGQNSLGSDENNSCGKIPESAKLVTPKETNHKIAKNGIAAWLKKPCGPKTVCCPVCSKAVFLSKINQHLDNNCESDVNNKPDDKLEQIRSKSNNKVNRLISSHSTQKDVNDDSLVKPKDCKSGVVFTPAEDDCENEVPLEVTSNSDQADVVSLGKNSERMKRNQPIVVALNDCNFNSVCNGITEGDSPCQESCVCTEDVTVKRKEQYNDSSDVLHKNQQKYTRTSGVAKLPADCAVKEEEVNESLAEQNSESEFQENKDHEPYYLANFKLVLTNVLSNEDDRLLCNEQDNSIIDTFNEMSAGEQKLYIRLFQRKRGWFRCDKLEYPKICRNIKPIVDSLIQKGFLEDEHKLTDLRETLNLIAAPELKHLVKSLHISSRSAGQKGGTKEDTIETIVSHADNQKTLFGSFKGVVLKRAKQVLGSCVRLAADPRDVFCRVLLLFTMNVIPDDEDTTNNGQAQQLSTLFLANIGKVVYPAYVIDRPMPVFHSRDSLIAFADAYQQKHEMFMALEKNNFDQAYSYYPEAAKKFDDILARLKGDTKLLAVLPEHLRCFTAEWAITKMCYFGVEVFQKWRQYDDAVNQLEKLLEQDVFCFDSRGHWYDRLALNLHQHLKRPEKAMEVIRQGLSDPCVRFGRRLALIQRAKRILSSPAFQKGKKKKCAEDFTDLDLKEPNPSRSITISGTRCAELGVFIAPEINQDGEVIHGTTTFCAVEEYALSYYRQQGFDQGIHGEGSTFSSLYCLFMWDIIFSSGIPDVFRSLFQAAPLDMCFDSFYTNRKKVIDKRLKEIMETPVKRLQEMLYKSWNDNEGQLCAGLSWERFTNVEQAKQLVGCLGGSVLCGIFTRFAQGYRYHRSGLPDLVVWNSSTLDYRIAEVKGPGDKLSTKQQIWLEVLDTLGANVEVCYVTDVGAKRLKVSK